MRGHRLAALALAGLAAPACALILGAEELPEAIDAGAEDAGDAAPDHADATVDADGADAADALADAAPGPCDCASTEAWVGAFAATGDVAVAGVAVDAQGRIVVAGSVAGDLDVAGHVLAGGSDHDVFVIALDSCGKPRWSRRFGDGAEQSALAVAVDPASAPHPGAIVITGAFAGTLDLGGAAGALDGTGTRAFVARLDPETGDGIAGLGVGSDPTKSYRGTSVAVAADGSAFWAGVGDSDASLFVRRLDPQLEVTHQITPACASCSAEVAVVPSGVAVAGGFEGSLDLAQGGPGPLGAAGSSDVFAAVLVPQTTTFDEAKTHAWGDAAEQLATSMATSASGGVFIAGAFAGTLSMGGGGKTRTSTGSLDAFVTRLDGTVSPQWIATFGGGGLTADQRATAIALGTSLAVVGSYAGALDLGADAGPPLQSAGDDDVFLLALDPVTGAVRAADRFGGAGSDHAAGVAIDGSGSAIVAGVLGGPASFACGTVGGSGRSVFVARRPLP